MSRKSIIAEVAKERGRQVNKEHHCSQHDDQLVDGEMARCAAAYSIASLDYPGAATKKVLWPWPEEQFKPKDHRRNLIRAAALLVAELERLERGERTLKSTKNKVRRG